MSIASDHGKTAGKTVERMITEGGNVGETLPKTSLKVPTQDEYRQRKRAPVFAFQEIVSAPPVEQFMPPPGEK